MCLTIRQFIFKTEEQPVNKLCFTYTLDGARLTPHKHFQWTFLTIPNQSPRFLIENVINNNRNNNNRSS